ncbi:helix-turn-helix domain-containing protein [Eubacterium sp.]|uniref:helix-turn-helix domain-containing protein n=1 Tax=Eubacterium sp. TaxID=142586 RepID=UPI0026E0B51A|nr:hypothetical protein [Eubacterium sp.]MDO5434623.1 hypothetical protein [Eubacterium sp.]
MKEIDGYKYLTIAEFALNNGISDKTVYNYLETGKIDSAAVINVRPRLIREDALEWEQENSDVKPVIQRPHFEENTFQQKILEEMQHTREEKNLECETYREQLKRKDEQLAESERQREADREYYTAQLAEKDRQIADLMSQVKDSGGHMQKMNVQFAKVADQAQQLQLVSMTEKQRQLQNNAPIQEKPQEEPEKKYTQEDMDKAVRVAVNKRQSELFDEHIIQMEEVRKSAEEEVLKQLQDELTPVIKDLQDGKRMYMGPNAPEIRFKLRLPIKFKLIGELYNITATTSYTLGKKRGWGRGWDDKRFAANKDRKQKEYYDECDRDTEKYKDNTKNLLFPTVNLDKEVDEKPQDT